MRADGNRTLSSDYAGPRCDLRIDDGTTALVVYWKFRVLLAIYVCVQLFLSLRDIRPVGDAVVDAKAAGVDNVGNKSRSNSKTKQRRGGRGSADKKASTPKRKATKRAAHGPTTAAYATLMATMYGVTTDAAFAQRMFLLAETSDAHPFRASCILSLIALLTPMLVNVFVYLFFNDRLSHLWEMDFFSGLIFVFALSNSDVVTIFNSNLLGLSIFSWVVPPHTLRFARSFSIVHYAVDDFVHACIALAVVVGASDAVGKQVYVKAAFSSISFVLGTARWCYRRYSGGSGGRRSDASRIVRGYGVAGDGWRQAMAKTSLPPPSAAAMTTRAPLARAHNEEVCDDCGAARVEMLTAAVVDEV
jgi:hypothetical protein